MREMQAQQAYIETLLAQQRQLLEARESLSDELCGKMSQLWSDVSALEPSCKKKKRGFCEPDDVVDFDVCCYRSCTANSLEDAVVETVTYRSLGDVEIDDESDLDELSASHARDLLAADTCSNTTYRSLGSGGAGAGGGGGQSSEERRADAAAADETDTWSMARSIEILAEIVRRLQETNTSLGNSKADPLVAATAGAALDGALTVSSSLATVEAH